MSADVVTQLVCVGDSHFHRDARQADRLKALDEIIAAGQRLPRLGAWLWPGDLFHGLHTTHVKDRNELADRLLAMADFAPVFGCRGNHDPCGELAIFERLRARWPIYLPEQPCMRRQELPTGHVLNAFILPWPDRAGLVAEGVPHAELGQVARQALDALFMDAADKLRNEGGIPVFLTHASITGSVASNGQPQVAQGIEVDGSMLARLGPILKVANHIHLPQEIAGAVYPGSITSMDFGEVHAHRYLVVDYFERDRFDLRSITLETPGLWVVEGELSRDGFTWSVQKGPNGEAVPPPVSWRGQEVKVKARFRQSEKNVLDLARAEIFANFAEAKAFTLDLVAVPDRALRAPAVAVATSIADKVVAWAAESGAVLPETIRERLQHFEAADPELLVKAVAASMAALLEPEAQPPAEVESEAKVA